MKTPPKPPKQIKPLPLPIPPKRSLTPPAQRAIKETFDFDSPTPTRNETLQKYTALLSIYDLLDNKQRVDLIELAFVFKELSEEDRKEILDWAIEKVFGELK